MFEKMLLSGYTEDKDGNAIAGAIVEVKDAQFQTIYQAQSDIQGYYSIELPAGKYPFLTAVRDYGVDYLEYWCQNINLTQDMSLDIRFDSLEIYGLHAFEVKGAYPSLMVYFRPMSLEKYKKGEPDICPEINSIRAFIDGKAVSVLVENKVREYIGEDCLSAFLIQIALPSDVWAWNRLDVEVRDNSNAFGTATIFSC